MGKNLKSCVADLDSLQGHHASFHMIDYLAHIAYELGLKEGARPTAKVVLLLPDSRVVIISRNKKRDAKRLCLPGGGIDYHITGEDLLPALKREVAEELRVIRGSINWDEAKFLGPSLVATKRDGWQQKLMLPVVCTCTEDFEVIPNDSGDGPPDQIYLMTARTVVEFLASHRQPPDREKYLVSAIVSALRICGMYIQVAA